MRYISFIWIVVFFTMIIGCDTKKSKSIIISGIIPKNSISIAELKLNGTVLFDTIENGKFHFELEEYNESYVDLNLTKWITLFITEGDSIHITINHPEGTIGFSGRGFEESDYIQQKHALAKELSIDDPRKINIALFSSKSDEFVEKIDSIQLILSNHLEDYKQEYPFISDSFYNYEQLLIQYYWINQRFSYPGFHKMLTHEDADIPDDYYQFTELIETNNSVLYRFGDYKAVLNSFLEFEAKKTGKASPTDLLYAKYDISRKLIENDLIFEDITFRQIRRHMSFNGVDDIDSLYHDFLPQIKNIDYKNHLTNSYSDWQHLMKGNKAPDFEIEDTEGRVVKLSDFYGKLVYIDCWSTYCGPCIAEMPAMKVLADDFNSTDIAFLSISVDTDKKRWRAKLEEYNLNTVNLCTGGTRHQFNFDYNAKAFPRYILIDRDGNIIDATAEKPSEIRQRIELIL
ncbi:MAG: TlpA family protein disulfide reductase [Bacteroidales bacterium]|nr:TlpA family protein disulfide reductase [Bacteroidales bacterium]